MTLDTDTLLKAIEQEQKHLEHVIELNDIHRNGTEAYKHSIDRLNKLTRLLTESEAQNVNHQEGK